MARVRIQRAHTHAGVITALSDYLQTRHCVRINSRGQIEGNGRYRQVAPPRRDGEGVGMGGVRVSLRTIDASRYHYWWTYGDKPRTEQSHIGHGIMCASKVSTA